MAAEPTRETRSGLPCSGVAIDGSRVRLASDGEDCLRLQVLGPNGGLRADVLLRDGATLATLSRGFAEVAPADVIPIGRRR